MADYAADRRLATRQRARARESTYLRNLDWLLLAAAGGIVAYGLWVIAGITKDDISGNPNYYVVRQAAYALVGCAGLAGMTLIDPGFWRKHSRIVYGLLIAMLVLTPCSARASATRGAGSTSGPSASSRPSSGSSCSCSSWPRSSPTGASGSTSG